MANNRVKVAGYAQRVFFNDGIEYRNFTTPLVGTELATEGGTPLFTIGNFTVSTNLEPKVNKIFTSNKFSNFVTLSSLDLTTITAKKLIDDNAAIILNLNKKNLNYYAYFGSLVEFVRVSLENIIINWPASLYVTQYINSDVLTAVSGYTVEDYTYNPITNEALFKVSTNVLNNKYSINYLKSSTVVKVDSTNELRDLTEKYKSYVISVNNQDYNLVEFTGSTNLINDYLHIRVKGDPFSGTSTSLTTSYHIKPSNINQEKFFNGLPDFEYYLLNRSIFPKYTAKFKFPMKSEETGVVIYSEESLTWPVSDGYNIDFDTDLYNNYASKLLTIATNSDLAKSNLITRLFVSESITSFDTCRSCDGEIIESLDQKMNKVLKVYGREFDEIKRFIDGVSLSNTVTYNKEDNTPDSVVKLLARVMGWELVSSIVENDLLKGYVETAPSQYSGHSAGLTAVEAEVEMWRRLILNTPWLWKSKGARKSIEFLFRFIGIPKGLVSFDEYIYKANKPIDVELFKKVLELNGLSTDLSLYNIDSEGYPKIPDNTSKMYFQKAGLWYRETGGANSNIDILDGNNPHVGPYDGGYEYIHQFIELIPNFSAVTITGETITLDTDNLFTNYNLGLFNNCNGEVVETSEIEILTEDSLDLSNCYVVTSEIITDPHPSYETTDCGCVSDDCDQSLKICIDKKETPTIIDDTTCPEMGRPYITEGGTYIFNLYQYNQDGTIYTINGNPVYRETQYIEQECCRFMGGTPYLANEYDGNGNIIHQGYKCCSTEVCFESNNNEGEVA